VAQSLEDSTENRIKRIFSKEGTQKQQKKRERGVVERQGVYRQEQPMVAGGGKQTEKDS